MIAPKVPFVLLATMIFVAGCAVGPKYRVPVVTPPPAYKESANWKPAQPSEQQLGGNWWEIFKDPQLNALEEQIDISNQNRGTLPQRPECCGKLIATAD